MRYLLVVVAALALSACGGGGGGGGKDNNSTGLAVAFSASALNFTYVEGQAPQSQVVRATASGSTTAEIMIGAEVSGSAISTPIHVEIDSNARAANIHVVPMRGLAAGTYNGSITMLACATAACTQHHAGSPHKVSYTVTVAPPLKASPSTLVLWAGENGTRSTTMTLAVPPNKTAVVAGISYKTAQTGWLSATVSDSTVTVQVAPRAMLPGTYSADLSLRLADGSQQVNVPVELNVSPGLLVASGSGVELDNTSTADQLKGSAVINLAAGSTATTWSATSNQAWLKIDKASATFNTPLDWHIDLQAFAALENGVHHEAVLTIRTDNGMTPQTFKIDAYKNLAQIGGLTATALIAGRGGDVTLYGRGFDRLGTPLAGAVNVGAATPLAVTRVSDKVLRLQMPALAEGSYDVSFKSASSLATPSRRLTVTPRATYVYQALDTAGLKSAVVWDSVSKSAFVANRTLNSVMRYAAVNGSFQLIATRSFPFVDTIGMTPDRSALVVLAGGSKVHKLSPLDLSTVKTFDLAPRASAQGSNISVQATIMGDNRMYVANFGWVDLDTGAVTPLNLGYSFFSMAEWGAVSGDGGRMLWSASGLVTPASPTARFDLADGKFVQTSGSFFYRYAANYDGTRWAYNNAVVDFDLGLKGRVSVPSGWNGNTMAFSRNGSRLYYYTTGTAGTNKARVYVFDTSTPVTTTVDFPILGYIELNDTPNCPYNPSAGFYEGCYTFNTQITIADDDQTLFIAGDRKFLVVPIPASVAPTPAARPARMVRM